MLKARDKAAAGLADPETKIIDGPSRGIVISLGLIIVLSMLMIAYLAISKF